MLRQVPLTVRFLATLRLMMGSRSDPARGRHAEHDQNGIPSDDELDWGPTANAWVARRRNPLVARDALRSGSPCAHCDR